MTDISNKRNIVAENVAKKAELDEMLAHYRASFPQFCRAMKITPHQLRHIDTSVITAEMVMRTFELVSSQLQEQQLVIAALERRIHSLEVSRAAPLLHKIFKESPQ